MPGLLQSTPWMNRARGLWFILSFFSRDRKRCTKEVTPAALIGIRSFEVNFHWNFATMHKTSLPKKLRCCRIPITGKQTIHFRAWHSRHLCCVRMTGLKICTHCLIWLQDGAKQQKDSVFRSTCCRAGKVTGSLKLKRGGYVPGERIHAEVDITNFTTRKIKETSLALVQVSTHNWQHRDSIEMWISSALCWTKNARCNWWPTFRYSGWRDVFAISES